MPLCETRDWNERTTTFAKCKKKEDFCLNAIKNVRYCNRANDGSNARSKRCRTVLSSASFVRDSPVKQRQQHFHHDQDDHDDFQHFAAVGGGLIGQDLVDALDHFQLPLDAMLPIGEMKARGQLPVDAGQVLIAHQLENVAGSLEQV